MVMNFCKRVDLQYLNVANTFTDHSDNDIDAPMAHLVLECNWVVTEDDEPATIPTSAAPQEDESDMAGLVAPNSEGEFEELDGTAREDIS